MLDGIHKIHLIGIVGSGTVSYTHLDVYNRQGLGCFPLRVKEIVYETITRYNKNFANNACRR